MALIKKSTYATQRPAEPTEKAVSRATAAQPLTAASPQRTRARTYARQQKIAERIEFEGPETVGAVILARRRTGLDR